MKKEDREKLTILLNRLFITHTQLQIVQVSLEQRVEKYGMSSDMAVEAAQMHSRLSLNYFQLEDELFELLDKDQ